MAVAVPILPALSLALKVTIVSPMGSMAGASLVMAVIAPSISSVAVAEARKSVTAWSVAGIPAGSVAAMVVFAGDVTVGAVWSL